MGFFAGVVKELDRIEDREERRKEFMATLLEKRKTQVLPILLDRIKENKEKVAEIKAKMKLAKGFGFSDEAAAVLDASGDLDTLLVRLKKLQEDPDKEINETAINVLSDAVVSRVPPEKVAAAMDYAFNKGFAENPSTDKIVDAIYANTAEEFQTALKPLAEAATYIRPSSPNIGFFNVNEMALTSMDTIKQGKVQKQMEKTLLPLLGGGYNRETDMVTWAQPEAAGIIIQNAVEYFKAQAMDPLIQKNDTDIYDEVFDKVKELKNREPDLFRIANDYPTFDITGAPEPIVVTEEQRKKGATELLMEESNNKFSIIDQEALN